MDFMMLTAFIWLGIVLACWARGMVVEDQRYRTLRLIQQQRRALRRRT